MRSMMISLALAVLPMVSFAQSASTPEPTAAELEQMAQDKFKATFTGTTSIHSFGPSPIEGVYQMQTQSGLLYYYPEKELLVFGRIYNKDGIDLTGEAERKHNQSIVDRIDLSSAVVLGNPDAETSYIEITNPMCGHCINYHRWTKTQENANVKRYVFFQAKEGYGKAESIHMLCHPQDIERIYNREKVTLETCPEGEARFEQHSAVMAAIGGVPTPAFIIDGKPLVGFDQQVLTNLYRKSQYVETN
ncbi:disulfide isomerase DsbC N-terminal domain-containing protein [Alteromonas macleodii]|uniref:Thiol:disulfide interchange protein DsbC n=1 Tax=Alteromonas macleodii TaxID=28108 RepID=A0AB36FL49_ALTMA|nr:disulfide isomerase DsbC N-terminal domain-containing protein [Alteromonas macleodii]OES24210.1 disulfide bond isomerase family protein [Alteromonas macleodii]OES24841.1 disulfide bond isomerase family protein [Alteromonas macleodii]OES25119.1 disulfide bond isomerase family protein [Alteromonas macleodii]OES39162.1 disulfide bond isomerase family protein [Alteromonas macleodii]